MRFMDVFFKGLFVLLASAVVTTGAMADGYEVTGSSTYSGTIKIDQPIDVNIEVGGVKLGSVFFDSEKLQAFVILQNRTPIAVSPEIGVALFDAKGKLIATGINVTGFSFGGDKIGAGDQKNIELSFKRFNNDYKNAASFQMVLSLGKLKETQASRAATFPTL